MSGEEVLVPVGAVRQHLDNDSPDYVFSPDLYLALALGYDSLAAPLLTTGSDGVVSPDFDRMQPRLAVRWDEEPSGHWLVELRRGARSQAGHELTSADIAFAFEKARAQQVMAAWRWFGVVGVEEVEEVSRYAVRFRLRAPYPTFPNWLLSLSPNVIDATAVREHASVADPWGIGWLDGHVAGFGAYALAEQDASHLLFEGRGDYWAGPPRPTRVDVRRWDDRADAIAQLRESRAAVVVGLDPDETAALQGQEGVRLLRSWAGHVSVEIDFGLEPFDDVRVRHALALAVPYERVRAEGLLGFARPWNGPVKGVSQWRIGDPLPYDYEPARARSLLADAGVAGVSTELYLDNQPSTIRMARIIAESWEGIGVSVRLRDIADVPAGELPPLYLRTECGHNTSEPLYDVAHDYAPMNPLLPLPGGEPHVGNWRPRWRKNPEAIAAFVEVLMERDAVRKRERFAALQRELVGFGSSIFLAEMQHVIAANDAVPDALLAPDSHFVHALALQNCTTGYLPGRALPPVPSR